MVPFSESDPTLPVALIGTSVDMRPKDVRAVTL